MHLDFASEYAKRSDEEIRLLVKDRQNLVEAARDALDVEVRKRRSNGFDPHAREPEEPRVHVEEDDEEGNKVVVRSRELVFPKICPRCLAPVGGTLRIVCPGSSWGLFPVFRYLFFSYPVPFCRICAISMRLRSSVLWVLGVIAGTFAIYTTEHFHLSALIFLLILIGLFALGGLLWKFFDLSKRWPPAGIEILSKWSARERRLEFDHPEYEKAFIALNGRKAGRD
jgi:hypothetical protein